MKRTRTYSLTASLFVLVAAGCRNDEPTNTPDLGGPQDLTMPPTQDLTTPGDMTQLPISGEVSVVVVGDGAAALSNTAAPVVIEKRSASDGALIGTPVSLPTTTAGANRRLTIVGNSKSEGALSRSGNGQYLVIGGYDAAVASANPSTQISMVVNRVIGRIDAAGNVDTSTAGDFFDSNNIRSATSSNGTAFWAAANALGIVYMTLGSTSATPVVAAGNMRWLNVIDNQLYVTLGAGTMRGVHTVGTGTPMGTATTAVLPGMSSTTGSPYGYVAFDRDSTAGIDTIYVADDGTVATSGGIHRWVLNGSNWSETGVFKNGLMLEGCLGVTGFLSSGRIILIATTDEAEQRIVRFIDDGTAPDQVVATELAKVPMNKAYRGIALAPQ